MSWIVGDAYEQALERVRARSRAVVDAARDRNLAAGLDVGDQWRRVEDQPAPSRPIDFGTPQIPFNDPQAANFYAEQQRYASGLRDFASLLDPGTASYARNLASAQEQMQYNQPRPMGGFRTLLSPVVESANLLSEGIDELPIMSGTNMMTGSYGGYNAKPTKVKNAPPPIRFAAQAAPYVAVSVATGGAADAAFTAQGLALAADSAEKYRQGEISGQQALFELGMNVGPLMVGPALHAAGAGASGLRAFAESEHGQAILRNLNSERGSGPVGGPFRGFGGKAGEPDYQAFLAENGTPKGAKKVKVDVRNEDGSIVVGGAQMPGYEPVPGIVVYDARGAKEPGWVLLHKPTGMMIHSTPRPRAEAFALARLMGKYGDWMTLDAKNLPEWAKDAARAGVQFTGSKKVVLPTSDALELTSEDVLRIHGRGLRQMIRDQGGNMRLTVSAKTPGELRLTGKDSFGRAVRIEGTPEFLAEQINGPLAFRPTDPPASETAPMPAEQLGREAPPEYPKGAYVPGPPMTEAERAAHYASIDETAQHFNDGPPTVERVATAADRDVDALEDELVPLMSNAEMIAYKKAAMGKPAHVRRALLEKWLQDSGTRRTATLFDAGLQRSQIEESASPSPDSGSPPRAATPPAALTPDAAIKRAVTGQPFEAPMFRGESDIAGRNRAGVTPERGRFFSPDEAQARVYAGQGDVVAEQIALRNPLVVADKSDAAATLNVALRGNILDHDAALARAAREQGYDGIVYQRLDEVQALTSVPGEYSPDTLPDASRGPQEPPTAAEGAGGGVPPDVPPTAVGGAEPPDGPLPPTERQRIAKTIASGVERQGPEFVHQEAMRSQQRSQRAARLREIRNDKSLTPEERRIESRKALAGEYFRGEYTPLEISDADFGAATRMIIDSDLREFEWHAATVALARLKSGQGLRNFEQVLLGRVFGPEVLRAIKTRNESLASNIARLWGVSAEDVARAARDEELARPAGTVKRSALDSPESVASQRIDTLVGRSRDKAVKARIQQQLDELRDAWTTYGPDAETERTAGRDRTGTALDAYSKRHPNADQLAERAGTYLNDRLAELRKVKRPTLNQTAEIARLEQSAGLTDTVTEAIRYWQRGNDAILNNIGETKGAGKLARIIQTAVSGEVTDSWVAALATRQTFMEMALLRMGLDPVEVGKIGDMLFDAEVQDRFGTRQASTRTALADRVGAPKERIEIAANVPEVTRKSIDMLKGLQLHNSQSGTVLEALANVSEEFKNAMFGVDLGVFGLQARAALQGGWIPGLAGGINRSLTKMHLPGYASVYLDSTLDRQIANILDGLYYGRGPAAAAQQGKRGLVMSIPGYGATVDKLTEFQFGTVLGGLRDTLYEGNLVILKLAGRDIENPQVRAKAAEWANQLTGWAKTAQTAKRQRIERAALISPGMTRAQVGEIVGMAKFLNPKASVEDRMLAALAVASYATSWLAAGKLINDYFGVKDFEFDPTKPGAGTITMKIPGMGETSVPFMANASLKRTILQSFRYLAEGDEGDLANAWLRYSTARQAAGGRLATGLTTGRGYTPEGKFTEDISREDLFKSMIPVPPSVQSQITGDFQPWEAATKRDPSALTEGFNPSRFALESLGVNNYPRSTFDKADETIREHGGDFRAALLATEGDERDIVKYRWRQDLSPRLAKIDAYVVPGEPGRAPRIEFREWDAMEERGVQSLISRMRPYTVPDGNFKTFSALRTAMIEKNLDAYMKANGVGISEARAALGRNFDAIEGVKNAKKWEQQFRLDKWKANPDLLNEAAAVDWETLNEDERKILEPVR